MVPWFEKSTDLKYMILCEEEYKKNDTQRFWKI